MSKEKKLAKLEQKIKTAQLDIMAVNSEPLMTKEEMKAMDSAFVKFASGTILATVIAAYIFQYIMK